jgi:hypothetical protein
LFPHAKESLLHATFGAAECATSEQTAGTKSRSGADVVRETGGQGERGTASAAERAARVRLSLAERRKGPATKINILALDDKTLMAWRHSMAWGSVLNDDWWQTATRR